MKINRLRINKKKINKYPFISIITVVFNNVSHLQKTINSILNQKYKNFELIVIDGGSTDGTLDVIKENKKKNWYMGKWKRQRYIWCI